MSQESLQLAGIAVLFLVLLGVLRSFWKDFVFYRRNGWDFSQQGGATDVGPSPDGGKALYPYDPRTRIFLIHPLSLVGLIIVLIVLIAQLEGVTVGGL